MTEVGNFEANVIARYEAIPSYGVQMLAWDCFSSIAMTFVANGKQLVIAKKMPRLFGEFWMLGVES
jgi:hypothetical protein